MADRLDADESRRVINIVNDTIVADSDSVDAADSSHAPDSRWARIDREGVDPWCKPSLNVRWERTKLPPSRGLQLEPIVQDSPSSALTCSQGTDSPGSSRAFCASTES